MSSRTKWFSKDMLVMLFLSLGIVLTIISIFVISRQNFTLSSSASEYKPKIRPSDYTTNITNPYFKLLPGKTMTYMLDTSEGLEKIEIKILPKRKLLMGVSTIIYWDRVWLDTDGNGKFSNKELIEETYDYLAQDKKGNVWYFGEEVDNYENGKLVDHAGSWLAGEDGAQPGIWIKGTHKVGDSYRQEYYAGEAEDMRDVVATNITVKTKLKEYSNCVQMYDWTPLDPESREYKYYCPEVGALVKSEHLDEEKNPIDSTELVKIKMGKNIDDEGDQQEID